MNINRVTLQHNNEFIMLIFFLFSGIITMRNLDTARKIGFTLNLLSANLVQKSAN